MILILEGRCKDSQGAEVGVDSQFDVFGIPHIVVSGQGHGADDQGGDLVTKKNPGHRP